MPINSIFWSSGKDQDHHVVVGQPSPDLTDGFLFFIEVGAAFGTKAKDYLAANADVRLKFKPLFKGVEAAGIFSGHGIQVNTANGIVTLTNPLPNPRKNNFILEVEATLAADNSLIDKAYVRVHVHQSISQVWLTPDTLDVRAFSTVLPDLPGYGFSVRAQFDNGVVGDITNFPGIVWSPAAHVQPNSGKLKVSAGENPGNTFVITAQLPAAVGGASATATKRIGAPWDVAHPVDVSIVVGGGWPGTINPEVVPNVLFLGDGFAAADEVKFGTYVNSLVQFLKTNPLNRPYDVLSTSINFWKAFLPSDVRGVSVRAEVYPTGDAGDLRANIVDEPEKPPAGAGIWTLKQLIYMVGLPVRTDDISNAARTNAAIKTEWQSLVDPNPTPNVNDALINRWRALAKRSFIDEVNSPLGVAVGKPVSNRTADFIQLHPRRIDRDDLDSLLRSLRDPRGIPVQDLWAKRADGTKPNNYDMVCILVAGKGRAVNSDGYFFVDVLDDIKIAPIAGKNAFSLRSAPADIPGTADNDRSRTLAHELTHSFRIDDEYGEREGPPVGVTSAEVDEYSNIALEADTKRAGQFHGDEIKWNWHRVRKAGVLDAPIQDVGGGKFKLTLRLGHGYQFAVGDTVHLRFREFLKALPKNPKMSAPLEIVAPAPTSNEIHVQLKAGAPFPYPPANIVAPANFIAEFPAGCIVFIPTPAPPGALDNATYPYAEMIGKNIKKYITDNNKPLTRYPSVVDDNNIQQPIIPGVSLPDCFNKNRPRIVGLYSGGDTYHKGVFHATGNCIMRDSHTDGKEFCAVCRYILVDLIDPTKHWEIDRNYAEFYPQE